MDYPYDRVPSGWTVADFFRACYEKEAHAKDTLTKDAAIRKVHAAICARYAPLNDGPAVPVPFVRIAVGPQDLTWPANLALEIEAALRRVL